jgi:glycosyltransferase involved in cell wall biosynthesis
MGGTERWMNRMAKILNTDETAHIITIHPKIANHYGRLVLSKEYLSHASQSEIHDNLHLTFSSFIPLTKNWKVAKKAFSSSRLIYTKYEILEVLILFYFLGTSGFKKIIVGVHSPFIYKEPLTIFDSLHNMLYGSYLYKFLFTKLKNIHVLNKKDHKHFTEILKLNNVIHIPNGVEESKDPTNKALVNRKVLNVLFAGELSMRKGIDILIKVMKKSTSEIKFTITGDGPMKNNILRIEDEMKNISYVGYSNKYELEKLYSENDVLILTSRAESMPLSVLEALSFGLTIVNSSVTSLDLDKSIEYSCDNSDIDSYIETLNKLYSKKKNNKMNKSLIKDYFRNNFSSTNIDLELTKKLFKPRNI